MKVWKLLTGKISLPSDTGEMQTHKAPYIFYAPPTEGELRANRFRMVQIDIPSGIDTAVPVAENTQSVSDTVSAVSAVSASIQLVSASIQLDDIRRTSVKDAVDYISTVASESELERLLLQEVENKPKIRKVVLTAIETQREKIQKSTVSG